MRTWLLVSVGLNLIAAGSAVWAVHRLGGWRFTAHRLHTLAPWPTMTQRTSQLELLPIAAGDVVMLGDSHVAYGEWSEWLGGTPVQNRGIPGATVPHVTAFAKTLDLRATRTTVLQVGTNDLLFGAPHHIVVGYDSLVDQLLSQMQAGLDTRVIVCTLPGVNDGVRWTGLGAHHVVELNEGIRALAKRHPQVEVLDLAAELGSDAGVLPGGLTDDGVHLRGEGYQKWVTALRSRLRRGTTFAQ